MNLHDAEAILRKHSGMKGQPIHDEMYELTFESKRGLQIALNRKATKTAVRVWIEKTIDPHGLGLSAETKIEDYPRSRPRAHLSARRLTGPYKGRSGNEAWYVSLTSQADFDRLIDAYLA